MLRLPAAPPAALRCLRLAVPRVGSLFAPRRGEPACLGPGLGHPVARPEFSRGDDRASQVPGHPPCTHAPLSDPGGISVPGHSRHFDAAFRYCDDVGFHAYQLSGLYHAACALPVYASQRRLPERHATLGSGWWPAFAGRGWLPAGMLRGFQSSLLVHLIPPLQALPGATQSFVQPVAFVSLVPDQSIGGHAEKSRVDRFLNELDLSWRST